ncbi:hypothetical protein WAI453_009332 [Rhynchosporium graminicola]|uniref:SH3 domain-containing protein n=1 Tax=Rhynchosporium graminicola TaxID=2792576 RepID=A0A1E1LI85_9HELO|nr:uncharacterized protein RCO7_02954 [Rhynchosporium commune]
MDHNHNHLHRAHARQEAPAPAVQIVYVTAAKTFDGPVGGYSTVGIPISKSEAPKPKPQPTPSNSTPVAPKPKTFVEPAEPAETPPAVIKPSNRQTTLQTQTSDLPTEITAPKTAIASSLPLLAATGHVSKTSSTHSAPTSSATAGSSSSSSDSNSNEGGGMSTGGKIGMAVGILLLLGGILAIILFCFKKRKAAAKEVESHENEKYQVDRAASIRTTATAPRLSLRPITQFLPNLAEKRGSRGNPLAIHLAPVAEPGEKGAWDRQVTGQSNNQENPFGNHAETIPPQNPFSNHANIDPVNASGPAVVEMPSEPMVIAAAATAPVGLKRGDSKRENTPAPMDFTKAGPYKGQLSPAATEFSMSSEAPGTPVQTSSGAAIAAAGGPVNSAVHRVQLDFHPSMEDELDLKQGQLIRVLHEYDDGWALCIRLDRSKQGVVPRTCLSTRPVKPRPMQNGPRGPPPPGMRGPPQQQQQQRPMSPGMNAMNGQRMAPNALQIRPSTPNGQHPRPASPAGSMQQRQPRPMVQGQEGGRARSNSAAQTQRPRIAPGPSQMNPMPQFDVAGSPPQGSVLSRKPVPGQAL